MANYNGNPNIAIYGQRTQFGQPKGADSKIARKMAFNPWLIRNAVRRIGCTVFDANRPFTVEYILNTIAPKGKATGAQYFAATLFVRAMTDGKANKLVGDIIDGPASKQRERDC